MFQNFNNDIAFLAIKKKRERYRRKIDSMILSTLTIPHSHTSHPSKLLWHATYLYKFSLRSAIDPSSRWYVRSIFPNGKKLAARRTNLTRASWFEFVKIASFPLAKESAPFVNPVAQMHARLYGRHLTIPDSTSWKNWQRNELPDEVVITWE